LNSPVLPLINSSVLPLIKPNTPSYVTLLGLNPTAGLTTLSLFNSIGTFPSFLIVTVTKTALPAPGAKAPPVIFKLTLVLAPAKNPET
jgi:hypothetical protein